MPNQLQDAARLRLLQRRVRRCASSELDGYASVPTTFASRSLRHAAARSLRWRWETPPPRRAPTQSSRSRAGILPHTCSGVHPKNRIRGGCRPDRLERAAWQRASESKAIYREASSYWRRSVGVARRALITRIRSPRSVNIITRVRRRSDCAIRAYRGSSRECRGSSTIRPSGSAKALTASSKATPCRTDYAGTSIRSIRRSPCGNANARVKSGMRLPTHSPAGSASIHDIPREARRNIRYSRQYPDIASTRSAPRPSRSPTRKDPDFSKPGSRYSPNHLRSPAPCAWRNSNPQPSDP